MRDASSGPMTLGEREEVVRAERSRISAEQAWLASGDTGVSSATIWSVMTGFPGSYGWYDTPHDPDDLGRCVRLLDRFPAWRSRMPEVALRYPRWAPLVEVWGELEALYREEAPTGKAPRCYARMQEAALGSASRRGRG